MAESLHDCVPLEVLVMEVDGVRLLVDEDVIEGVDVVVTVREEVEEQLGADVRPVIVHKLGHGHARQVLDNAAPIVAL